MVLSQGFDKSVLSELFSGCVEGFGYAIGVKGQRVAGVELAFVDGRIPLFEEAENGGSGAEPVDIPVMPEDEA